MLPSRRGTNPVPYAPLFTLTVFQRYSYDSIERTTRIRPTLSLTLLLFPPIAAYATFEGIRKNSFLSAGRGVVDLMTSRLSAGNTDISFSTNPLSISALTDAVSLFLVKNFLGSEFNFSVSAVSFSLFCFWIPSIYSD